LANAVNLAYGMRFNMEGQEDPFIRMARAMDLKEETGEALVDHLFLLNKQIGLPVKLSAIGVKQEHLDTLSDLAFADFCHPNNPKPVSREDFRKLYTEAF
jgi:alcohol dehydrogenase class IV